MTIKSKKIPSKRGFSLRKAMDRILEYPRSRVEYLKEEIFRDYHITAKGYQEYYDSLPEGHVGAKDLLVILGRIHKAEKNGAGTPFHTFSSAFKKWNDKYSANTHPHHSEYSNIASQLRTIYNALMEVYADIEEAEQYNVPASTVLGNKLGHSREGEGYAKILDRSRRTKPLPGDSGGYGTPLETAYTKKVKLEDGSEGEEEVRIDLRQLFTEGASNVKAKTKGVIEQFRRLYITALAISRKTDFDGDVDDLNSVTQDFVGGLDQAEWEAIKNKHVEVMNGEARMDITLVSGELNKLLAEQGEMKIGAWSQKLMQTGRISNNEWAKIQKDVDFGSLEGSRALKNEVAQQLSDALVKGKAKKYKSTSRKKAKASTKKSRKAVRVNKRNTRSVPLTRATGSTQQGERGSGQDNLVNTLRLQKLIQKRLPAEVRRNMGRPALINRTGRFSDSVELTRLTQGAGGISGEYTYRLSPYETFENSGSRRWPTGYNPKTLIAKSIRNLAVQYTNQRFTYLRRN